MGVFCDRAMAKEPLYDFSKYSFGYYLKGALSGGVCCSITHGGACPIDVVKTRIQLDPVKYNQGLIGGFRQVIQGEGAGALATGLAPTAVGYFVQGWFKFGGYEFFKVNFAKMYGDQGTWDNRFMIGTRIRQVSDPVLAKLSLPGAAGQIMAQDGLVPGFYSGFVPILFKQIPYTIAKFVVQDAAH